MRSLRHARGQADAEPAQFILSPRGEIAHTVYGEGPLGRVQAADVLRWVAFQRSRAS